MLCKALYAFKEAHMSSSGIDHITLYPFPNKASLEAEWVITDFQLIISCSNNSWCLTDAQLLHECVVDFDSLLLHRMDTSSVQFLLQELVRSLSIQRESEIQVQRPIESASHDSRIVLLKQIINESPIFPHNSFKFAVPQYRNEYVPMVPESKEFPTSRCVVEYVPYKEEMRIIFSDQTFKSIFSKTVAAQVNKLLFYFCYTLPNFSLILLLTTSFPAKRFPRAADSSRFSFAACIQSY